MVVIDPELTTWSWSDYAAGFRARPAGVPLRGRRSLAWRSGWQDAHVDLIEAERHNRVLAAGEEDDYPETWGMLFDAGGDARVAGIPFEENRTAPWKEGWIDADINLEVIRAS
jgi:hypothetical protein